MSLSSGLDGANMQTLMDSDVLRYFSVSYSSFIVFLPREGRDLRELKLPDQFINSIQERIPSNVVLELANGHETHVNFKKSKQKLSHMTEFNNDCRGLFGTCMIYSYKGKGKFFVNCLKDDLCEVIYFKNTRIARGTFYDQDLVGGIGRKFLVFLNNDSFQGGEIPIRGHFWRLFRKLLPPTVHLYMRNGNWYEGMCSKNDRKMYGLQDVVRDYGLSQSEKILFTYFGEGNFFIMIFENSNVEAVFVDVDSDSSDSEDDETEETEIGQNVQENVDDIGHGIENAYLDDDNMTFTSVMTACNVDSTSHGVYIPNHIQRTNREWIAGDVAVLRTGDGEWNVGIVISNKLPRFSGGWNKFARDNRIGLHETIVFNMVEEDNTTVFLVDFPFRP